MSKSFLSSAPKKGGAKLEESLLSKEAWPEFVTVEMTDIVCSSDDEV